MYNVYTFDNERDPKAWLHPRTLLDGELEAAMSQLPGAEEVRRSTGLSSHWNFFIVIGVIGVFSSDGR
jgi:hypothetical protein